MKISRSIRASSSMISPVAKGPSTSSRNSTRVKCTAEWWKVRGRWPGWTGESTKAASNRMKSMVLGSLSTSEGRNMSDIINVDSSMAKAPFGSVKVTSTKASSRMVICTEKGSWWLIRGKPCWASGPKARLSRVLTRSKHKILLRKFETVGCRLNKRTRILWIWLIFG